MKYAHHDEAGTILGFYDDAVHADIPTPAISLTDDQWLAAIATRHKVVNGNVTPDPVAASYADLRSADYPPITDYLDGVVKGDQAQIDAYIAACRAVKAKYPKPGDESDGVKFSVVG